MKRAKALHFACRPANEYGWAVWQRCMTLNLGVEMNAEVGNLLGKFHNALQDQTAALRVVEKELGVPKALRSK